MDFCIPEVKQKKCFGHLIFAFSQDEFNVLRFHVLIKKK